MLFALQGELKTPSEVLLTGSHYHSVSELWVILDLGFTLSFLRLWGLDRTTQLKLLPKLVSLHLRGSTHHYRQPKDQISNLRQASSYLSPCLFPHSLAHFSL